MSASRLGLRRQVTGVGTASVNFARQLVGGIVLNGVEDGQTLPLRVGRFERRT
jgi:hypothetical protein